MKAVVFEEFGQAPTIQTVPDPSPSPEGVVIKVEATGLCRSDWHGWMGHDPDIRLPHVPGHEFAGVVVAVGRQVTRWKAGDRVTVPFVVGCGRCFECTSGNHQVCEHQFQPGFSAMSSAPCNRPWASGVPVVTSRTRPPSLSYHGDDDAAAGKTAASCAATPNRILSFIMLLI